MIGRVIKCGVIVVETPPSVNIYPRISSHTQKFLTLVNFTKDQTRVEMTVTRSYVDILLFYEGWHVPIFQMVPVSGSRPATHTLLP